MLTYPLAPRILHKTVTGTISVAQSAEKWLREQRVKTKTALIEQKSNILRVFFCDAWQEYYRSCAGVSLDRQVGSRYFVTAANATKVVFLREAAVNILVRILETN